MKKDSILINSRENFKVNKNEKAMSLSAHSDHRIAMMIAIAATCYDGEILLDNLDCVKKSYPNFWEVFLSLGGKIYEYLGTKIRLSIFGESHGEALGIVIDGLEAGTKLNLENINKFIDRRRAGKSSLQLQEKKKMNLEF